MSNLPLYVSSLFGLLKELGIPQKAVATALGATKGVVSEWANGNRPMSAQYVRPFLALVAEAATTQRPEPWTLNSGMAWLQTRQKYIALWSAELQETMGVIARDFQRGCRILGSFARQNPVKFDPEQWDEIAEATRLISKARRLIQLRRQPPMRSCGDTENLSEEELLALFLEMAAWVEASSSSEDDTEERHDAS